MSKYLSLSRHGELALESPVPLSLASYLAAIILLQLSSIYLLLSEDPCLDAHPTGRS